MVTLIVNSKKVKCPVGWHETTVDLAQQIARDWDAKDKIKLFNILTGTEYAKVKADTNLGSVFWNTIQFVYFPSPVINATMPKAIAFDRGKIVQIPKNVGKQSIGQLIAVRKRMEEVQTRIESEMKDESFSKFCFKPGFMFDEMLSYACAVYLQPLWSGNEFDDGEAENLEAIIKRMYITDIYPLGFFLLTQQLNFGRKWGAHLRLKIRLAMHNARKSRNWPKPIY